jgi:hypothetical protein
VTTTSINGGADHHDEPEASGGEGSSAVGERLPGQSQGRIGDQTPARKNHILIRQWERLAEIQQIQLEFMQDPAIRKR